MLTDSELALIEKGACVPEHLPHYVEPISGATAHLHEGYVVFTGKDRLIFIGYPVTPNAAGLESACESACCKFRPQILSVIAGDLSFLEPDTQSRAPDEYFRLSLPVSAPNQNRAYMIKRARREVSVVRGTWGAEHEKLVNDFICNREIEKPYAEIFQRIPDFLESAGTARLLEARKGPVLSAFTVADFGSADYAFYLFNFRSTTDFVPGANDLLLLALVEEAHSLGKTALNLGLGINEGNRRFKQKWGGVPFLKYVSATVERPRGLRKTLAGLIRQFVEGRHPEGKT
ncbi:MAG: hypothetical protein K9J85_10120 [Desulfobacteraceae bacterium]|nr:hypothetical protein [Desulfobacteraceae bacterium]